jgi:hypothetical protein
MISGMAKSYEYREPELQGKLIFQGVRWLVFKEFDYDGEPSLTVEATCGTCLIQLQKSSETELHCDNPNCKNYEKNVSLGQDFATSKSLVRRQWEALQRRKDPGKWVNLDQEVVPLAETEEADEEHWVRARLFHTPKGKSLLIWVGKKGHKSKVQLFLKDEIDEISHDTTDLHPKEILLGFKAKFSDDTIAEIRFPERENSEDGS